MLQQQGGELASAGWHKPQELDQLARRADDNPEGPLFTVSWQVLLLRACSGAATNGCPSSHAQGGRTGTCNPMSASSRRACPPYIHGSHILQNRSMFVCRWRSSQESNSKSPDPRRLSPAAPRMSRAEQPWPAPLAAPSAGDVRNVGGPLVWSCSAWSRASHSLLKVSLWV